MLPVSMARPLRLLSRLAALSLMPSVSTVNSCRFASRGANKAWTGQSYVSNNRASRSSDEMSDDELQEVEDELQALVDQHRKKQKIVKYHRMKRKMTPSGAPERKLTWDAIEQIKYLKQELPEEWTVERLAEGYSVTPDVILRVLKSKFVPAPQRKVKQDATVMARLGQQVLPSGAAGQDRLKLPGHRSPAALPPGGSEGALVPVAGRTLVPLAGRTLMPRGEGSLVKRPAAPVTLLPPQVRAGGKDVAVTTRSEEEDSTYNTDPTEEEEEEPEDSWDGRLFTEEELKEFMDMKKHRPVVQVGDEFFDEHGNFLYRI